MGSESDVAIQYLLVKDMGFAARAAADSTAFLLSLGHSTDGHELLYVMPSVDYA